jgi:3-dehydroquinate synthase
MNPSAQLLFSEELSFDVLKEALEHLGRAGLFSGATILADINTEKCCYPMMKEMLLHMGDCKLITIPPGEDSKSLALFSEVTRQLILQGASRNTLLINLGGGMVSDLGGFVASVFKRGMPYINIPTSLLAMVDAAVGGKTGINFHHYKNLIGSFCFPELVFVNPIFLKTLPGDQWRSGLGELFKYAIISHEIELEDLRQLHRNADHNLLPLIKKSIEIKQQLVQIDPFDRNERHLLNVGHTVGHAFESACVEGGLRMTHGEAVAAGIVAECYLSSILEGFPTHRMEQIISLFVDQFAPFYDQLPDPLNVVQYLGHDKKNLGESTHAVLFGANQQPILHRPVPPQLAFESIQFLYQIIHGAGPQH